MGIGAIDFWATSGQSPIHRASALAKLTSATLLIIAVIVGTDPFSLLAIYLTAVAALILSGLPVVRLLLLAAYPALFALLFAVSRWSGSLLDPAVILLKALSAAAVMVALITTTPYPQLFALLRFLLPPTVADALFLTYRSIFLLMGVFDDLLRALRLRGGLSRHRLLQNLRNLAGGLGLLLVRGIAYSEQLYDVLRVRGYSGRMATGTAWGRLHRVDLLPLAAGALVLVAVLAIRFAPQGALYNGYLLLSALLAVLLAMAVRRPRTEG